MYPAFSSRKTWVACVLSLCCPGLGHLYAGRLNRGLVLFLLSLALIPVAALIAGWVSSTMALVGLIASYLALLGLWLFAVGDAWRITARTKEFAEHDYQKPVIYALFLAAGIGSPMLSVVYIRQNLLEAFYLPTESMSPTLKGGDRILANKTAWRIHDLKRSDVVVFRPPDERNHIYVKRLIGLPGDEVTIEGTAVKVNGKPVEMPGASPGASPVPRSKSLPPQAEETPDQKPSPNAPEGARRTLSVPPGMCFMLGDNVKHSRDSREFGPVSLGEIIGVAEYVYLPGDRWARFGKLQ